MKTRVDIRSGLFISYIARQAGEDSLHRSIRILAKAANVLQSTSCAPYAIGTSACGHEADLTFAHGRVANRVRVDMAEYSSSTT